MNQLSILDPPATRRTDPITSHIAEAEHTRSGRRACNRDYVRQLVSRWPGRTGRELSKLVAVCGLPIHLDYHEIIRRLNDLADDTSSLCDASRPIYRGEKRICKVSGRPCLTWWLK